MEALELIINLLEKVAVLVASTLFLLLLRPAEVWLSERGHRASPRRRAFLILVFAPIAIWGIFLGFDINGTGFNTRAIGIIVSGYLGGRAVGTLVGAFAGLVYVALVPDELAVYVFVASVLDGLLAGYWVKRFQAGLLSLTIGAIVVQLIHHVLLGAILTTYAPDQAIALASNVSLHAAKIGANTIGVFLVMGMLTLTRDLEIAKEDVQASRDLARSARLEALQYQLQPHFLFNLLNTLAYLIRTDPIRARTLTLDLSEFLRYTLSREEDQETSLHDELKQLERYVDLERARFGDGLKFSIEATPPELTSLLIVPPMILQPLVENALRHGAEEGNVEIKVEVSQDEDNNVEIKIIDDGPGPPEELIGPISSTTKRSNDRPGRHRGLGLQNIRERLERYYNNLATLSLHKDSETGGTCAKIIIHANATNMEAPSITKQAREHLRKAVLPD